jgi:hypothetical protein
MGPTTASTHKRPQSGSIPQRIITSSRSPVSQGSSPSQTDAERFFAFWTVRLQPEDGRVVQAKVTRAAELRACFGPTGERARSNFYAEIKLNSISFRGNGDCLAVKTDFPEGGLFPVRCQLILSGLPVAYVGDF